MGKAYKKKLVGDSFRAAHYEERVPFLVISEHTGFEIRPDALRFGKQ